MTHPELLMLSALRALVQMAMLFMLGQGLLALLAGGRRHTNVVYKLFVLLTQPVIKFTRWISPRQIIDKHVPFVAFVLLFWLLVLLTYLKKSYCDAHLLQCF